MSSSTLEPNNFGGFCEFLRILISKKWKFESYLVEYDGVRTVNVQYSTLSTITP